MYSHTSISSGIDLVEVELHALRPRHNAAMLHLGRRLALTPPVGAQLLALVSAFVPMEHAQRRRRIGDRAWLAVAIADLAMGIWMDDCLGRRLIDCLRRRRRTPLAEAVGRRQLVRTSVVRGKLASPTASEAQHVAPVLADTFAIVGRGRVILTRASQACSAAFVRCCWTRCGSRLVWNKIEDFGVYFSVALARGRPCRLRGRALL